MPLFENVNLAADPNAAQYVKTEEVDVRFADADSALESREGLNRYARGDALVTGSTGEQWSVTRSRFDARYEPVGGIAQGTAGRYRSRPIPVWAKQIREVFNVARVAGGDLLKGAAGDWLMQYAPGDYGIVENAKFRRVYRRFGDTVK